MELSLNAIILIALGLIVAVVLVYLLMKNSSGVSGDLRSCRAKGGTCVATGTKCPTDQVGSSFFTADCPSAQNPQPENYICCRAPV